MPSLLTIISDKNRGLVVTSAELLCYVAALWALGILTQGLTGTCPHSSFSLRAKSHLCWIVSHYIWNYLVCCKDNHLLWQTDQSRTTKGGNVSQFSEEGVRNLVYFIVFYVSQGSVIRGRDLLCWSLVLNRKCWRDSNKTWWRGGEHVMGSIKV